MSLISKFGNAKENKQVLATKKKKAIVDRIDL